MPREVTLEQHLDILELVRLEELGAQQPTVGQSLCIPAEVLSEVDDGAFGVPLEGDRVLGVIQTDLEALLNARIAWNGVSVQRRTGLPEQPWVSMRPSRDHDAGASGFVAHASCVVTRSDVSVPDHGNL